jgi:hypothetical protein
VEQRRGQPLVGCLRVPVGGDRGLVGGGHHLVALDNDGPSLEDRDAVQAPRLASEVLHEPGAARPKVQRANVHLGGEGAVPVMGDGDDSSRGPGGSGTNESPPSIATNSPAHP